MEKTLVLRCNNVGSHSSENKEKGEGNILMFLKGDCIYIKCSDHKCKVWNKIKICVPGIKVNFSNAAFIQSKMPKDYHFDADKATVVIEDNNG